MKYLHLFSHAKARHASYLIVERFVKTSEMMRHGQFMQMLSFHSFNGRLHKVCLIV